MPQLDPTWFISQLFWLLVSVTLLYAVLRTVALPPLTAVLEQRRQVREQDLAEAQRLKTEADKAREEYERVLADSRLRSQAIFAEVEQKGKQDTEAALATLNRTLHQRLTDAEHRITQSRDGLLRALEPAMAGLVSQAVEKLIGKRPDDKRVQAVVQQLLHSKEMASRGRAA